MVSPNRPIDNHLGRTALLPLGQAVQDNTQAQSLTHRHAHIQPSPEHGHTMTRDSVIGVHQDSEDISQLPVSQHKSSTQGQSHSSLPTDASEDIHGLHSVFGVHQDSEDNSQLPISQHKSCTQGQSHSSIPADASEDTHALLPHSLYSLDLFNGNPGDAQSDIPSALDPAAAPFQVRDRDLVHNSMLTADLASDWEHVQQVQAGGSGSYGVDIRHLWNNTTSSGSEHRLHASQSCTSQPEPVLPFQLLDNFDDVLGLAPKQIYKVSRLSDLVVKMPSGNFIDKTLPPPENLLGSNEVFTPDYYVALHNITSAPGIRADGSSYPAFTPNHIGARIKLPHVKLNIERWRFHLIGYENAELVQLLEYGFPLGLSELPDLESCSRNHGSAYMWYKHVDKFVSTELGEGGMTGPFSRAPWWHTVVSPLMTAHKKVKSRRTVFDATFGDKSLHNSTPSDQYMGLPCKYTFPKIEDYKMMILKSGQGAYMWKRDLSRFYLQLPADPTEFNRICLIWRGLFFFFLGLAFGLRHSGLQGQRVTDAITWILRRLGLEADDEKPYQACNYVDDIGGVEATKKRAMAAFEKLGWLLSDLGLGESLKKAEPPTTQITYLGVQFNSEEMTMSVPPDKITEIKAEIGRWVRRTTITKKELQSLLGKFFWVAKVVKYARAFMGRLLAQLRSLASKKDSHKVKLTDESRKDILWWRTYLDRFNGISMIVNDDPIPLTFQQLLDSPYDIYAGDATPTGGGGWHGAEYWSEELPDHLKDPQLPIHLKEFWVLIVSAKLWGDTWTGRCIVLYCDNDSVCDTLVHRKPRDPGLLSLLREFLHLVVVKKFFPVVRKIGTDDNILADHISRRHDKDAAAKIFSEHGLHNMVLVKPRAQYYHLSAPW